MLQDFPLITKNRILYYNEGVVTVFTFVIILDSANISVPRQSVSRRLNFNVVHIFSKSNVNTGNELHESAALIVARTCTVKSNPSRGAWEKRVPRMLEEGRGEGV